MDLGLKDKVAIVTGGGRGMGKKICTTLAEEGARVCVNDFFADRAKSVADEINAAGGQAIGIQADVTKWDSVDAMVKQVVAKWGTVHILCNSAGIPAEPPRREEAGGRYFAQQTRAPWDATINMNVYGILNCCKAVIGYMIDQRYGKIVSTLSDAARVGEPTMVVYGGAKSFISGFSKGLAKENSRFGINVNMIASSWVTREGTQSSPEVKEREKELWGFYPLAKGLERLGLGSDMANAYAFLVSDRAEWITGQILSVNGGYCMVD
ncbi:MAG: SDR family oxidoreductase [Chloroflexi bacterium]|nr:SDR family oxidoreductase [Chloroflexota bacterium]